MSAMIGDKWMDWLIVMCSGSLEDGYMEDGYILQVNMFLKLTFSGQNVLKLTFYRYTYFKIKRSWRILVDIC